MSLSEAARAPAATRADALSLVTDEIVEAFARDGAVWIPGLLSQPWLALLELGLKRIMNNPGPHGFWHFGGEPGQFWDDYCNYAATPEYQRLLHDSPIVDVMAKLLRSEQLWLFCDQIFVKEGYGKRTPWHQDAPYWLADGAQLATMWIALEPLSEAETLEIVRGSHKTLFRQNVVGSGEYVRRAEGGSQDNPYIIKPSDAPGLPDIDSAREKWPILSWASKPGDVLIFHPNVVHGGGEMHEGGRRRSVSLRFFGDDARYVEREIPPDPPFPGVSEALQPGEPLRHPWFPKLYPRPSQS